MHQVPEGSSAATDVEQFITDLDAGSFEHKLSVALSKVAAAVVDNSKTGEVKITLKFKHIQGTHQVLVDHGIKFTRPTASGKASEEDNKATVLHVGKYGKLSIAQQSVLGDGHKQTRIEGA